MEQQGNQKVPATLLPGVLHHLGLEHTSSTPAIPVESLLAMLNETDWRVRTRAISELEEHANSLPFDVLIAALHDDDVSVRAVAVRVLGRKGLLALPYINGALEDSEWLVREAAALTLGELGKKASMEKLLASLGDENEFVREATSMVLEQNRVFRPDDAEDDDGTENVIITNLDTSARASHSRRFATFRLQPRRLSAFGLPHATSVRAQPRRLAAVALTGLVVVVLLVGWLALIPALRSSRSAHPGLSFHAGTVLFKAHYQGGAYLPQWSPDGKHMAFVDEQGDMYVWDASTKKLNMTFTLPYPPKPDTLAVWSWTSDGQHIVSIDYTTTIQPGPFSSDTTIYLWDALTGKRVASFATQMNAWADDGKNIAIAGQNNIVHVLDMETGQEQFTISSEHFKKLWAISWSPDGKRIATSSLDGIVEIWSAATGNRLQSFSDPGIAPQKVHDITDLFTIWSPDSTRILTQRAENSAYKSLQIWDAATGRKLLTFSAHTSFPYLVRWFSDGKRVLSASDNETLIWEAVTGQVLTNIPNNHTQYPGTPVLSPDERMLAITDGGPTIQLWDTGTEQKVFAYRGHTANVIDPLAWSPDGTAISSADTDGNILVWTAATGKLRFQYKLNLSSPSNFIPTHLAFLEWSPDGTMLVIASDEGTIAVLQAN